MEGRNSVTMVMATKDTSWQLCETYYHMIIYTMLSLCLYCKWQ